MMHDAEYTCLLYLVIGVCLPAILKELPHSAEEGLGGYLLGAFLGNGLCRPF